MFGGNLQIISHNFLSQLYWEEAPLDLQWPWYTRRERWRPRIKSYCGWYSSFLARLSSAISQLLWSKPRLMESRNLRWLPSPMFLSTPQFVSTLSSTAAFPQVRKLLEFVLKSYMSCQEVNFKTPGGPDYFHSDVGLSIPMGFVYFFSCRISSGVQELDSVHTWWDYEQPEQQF